MSLNELIQPTDAAWLNPYVNNLQIYGNEVVNGNVNILGTTTVTNLNVTGTISGGGVGSSSDTRIVTTMNGPGFSVPYTYHITALIIGSVTHVTLHLPGNIQTASGSPAAITFGMNIPVPLAPTVSSFASWPVLVATYNGTSNVEQFGYISIEPTGVIIISSDAAGDFFAVGGNCGFEDLFVSWDLSSNV